MTGRVAREDELADATYWRHQARQPVRFAEGVATLRERDCEVFVEVGPAPSLLGLVRRSPPPGGVWLASLRPERDDWLQMLECLQALYVRGVLIDWSAFD